MPNYQMAAQLGSNRSDLALLIIISPVQHAFYRTEQILRTKQQFLVKAILTQLPLFNDIS